MAGNGGVSQQEHGKSRLLKLKNQGIAKHEKNYLGKNLTEMGRGSELSNESLTRINLSLTVHPWKAHGTVLQGVYLLHDS